ncbi:MAG: DNA repair protein RecO [Clostridia bacterium]|nr:DNA repair protein RecO [Clostridia bacterium]
MKLVVDGLVIGEKNTGESNRLITILTRDRGVIKAFANGARKIKSRSAAATELLCYSSFVIFKNKDTYSVDEATPNEVFFSLRSDIVKLSLAQYFCQLAAELVPEGIESEVILRTLLNSLHFLATNKRDINIIKAVTELRLIASAGYTPDLVACAACGEFEANEMWFDSLEGAIYCGQCAAACPPDALPLPPGVLAAMRHIIYSEFSKLYNFSLPAPQAVQLANISEKYLKNQVERGFTTLDFYHSLGV